MPHNFNNRSVRAFTLVEMILGFTIFALTAVTLYAVFSNGIKINNRATKTDQLYRELRWSLDVLAADLENMVNYEEYNDAHGPFMGDAQSLSLALPTDSGLKIIRYSLQSPERTRILKTQVGGHSSKNKTIAVNYSQEDKVQFLVREEIPFYLPSVRSEDDGGEADILSTHIQPGTLRLTYAAAGAEKNGALVWKNEWTDIHPPAMVRIELNLLNPDNPDESLKFQKNIFVPLGGWGTASSS